MAVMAHSTNFIEVPRDVFAGMSIAVLADLLDASDAAVSAMLSVMNLPRTALDACGRIEDWMEEFGFRRQVLIAELEARIPTSKAEEAIRLRALISRAADDCQTPFDVVAYVTKIGLHSSSH